MTAETNRPSFLARLLLLVEGHLGEGVVAALASAESVDVRVVVGDSHAPQVSVMTTNGVPRRGASFPLSDVTTRMPADLRSSLPAEGEIANTAARSAAYEAVVAMTAERAAGKLAAIHERGPRSPIRLGGQ